MHRLLHVAYIRLLGNISRRDGETVFVKFRFRSSGVVGRGKGEGRAVPPALQQRCLLVLEITHRGMARGTGHTGRGYVLCRRTMVSWHEHGFGFAHFIRPLRVQ